MSIAINLNAILKQTIAITRENEEWTAEQIMAEILTHHVKIETLNSISTGLAEKSHKSEKVETEKKTRTRAAPSKPRAIPEDETRCHARSFYEKEHLEGNVLKVMRDDAENLYGDRCKFKKTGESNFCKHHSEKQPLGIWGAEYSGKFKVFVEKTENPETVVVAAPKPKPVAKLTLIEDDDDESEAEEEVAIEEAADEEVVEEEEEIKIPVKQQPVPESKPVAAAPKPAPKIEEPEEEVEEVEECQIDGKTYLKDAEGTVYDPDTEEAVGKYNFATKKWISKAKK